MTYFLYQKTHNTTGLKYLGKTIADPYKYPGSGVYWTNHIKKHGNDVSTKVLQECKTEAELIKWGLYYSHKWNVVESKEWANLTEEAGPGGLWSDESKKKLSKSKKQELANMSKEERSAYVKRSMCKPESYTKERIENMRKGQTGKKKTKTAKLLKAEAERKNRSKESKMKCGNATRGKTWKIIDGKRVWMEKDYDKTS